MTSAASRLDDFPDCELQRDAYFTVTQVQVERWLTLWETLPIRRPPNFPRPREPMMIMSACSNSAAWRMQSAGDPSTI